MKSEKRERETWCDLEGEPGERREAVGKEEIKIK